MARLIQKTQTLYKQWQTAIIKGDYQRAERLAAEYHQAVIEQCDYALEQM